MLPPVHQTCVQADRAPSLLAVLSHITLCFFVSVLLLAGHGQAQDNKARIPQLFEQRVPQLIKQLMESQDASVRSRTAFMLGMMGSEAKEAVPALTAALKDQDVNVHGEAARALSLIAIETA